MIVLRTSRLILRPFTVADIPAYQAVRRDPAVTRFLPSHTTDRSKADARAAETVQAFAALWDDPGYGPWAVVRHDTGALIGHCGLRFVAQMDDTEVLYLLARHAWGQGYATEAAGAALNHGFQSLGLARIVAWAMQENVASQAVMARIGMTRSPGLVRVFGIDAVQYSARKPPFADEDPG